MREREMLLRKEDLFYPWDSFQRIVIQPFFSIQTVHGFLSGSCVSAIYDKRSARTQLYGQLQTSARRRIYAMIRTVLTV